MAFGSPLGMQPAIKGRILDGMQVSCAGTVFYRAIFPKFK